MSSDHDPRIRRLVESGELHAEDALAFETADERPPITRERLAELDVPRIINNPKLRHDVNFDRELHFRPNLDGSKGRKKMQQADAYWSALTTELFALNRALTRKLRWSFEYDSGSDNATLLRRLPGLLTTIRDTLRTLVPDYEQKAVEIALDVDRLLQQILRGDWNLMELAKWSSRILKDHCAPMRDSLVDTMERTMTRGAERNDTATQVDGLRQLLSILECMKLDVANHQIRNMRPLLVDDTANLQRRYDASRMTIRRDARSLHNAAAQDSVAHGRLQGKRQVALVDTCADNFISESTATDCRAVVDTSLKREIRRADGSTFWTLGSVSLPWKFKGEKEKHIISFGVLPDQFCHYAVTLGGRFLKSTKSLTDFASRIVRQVRKFSARCVRFQGSGQLRMDGYCEGRLVSALPDLASDVPLASPEFVASLQLPVDRSPDCCIDLMLPGDRIVQTVGMVRDVQWSFGDTSYNLDLYVLPGLPAEILLDADFLHHTDAFRQYTDLLYDMGEDDCDIFLAIDKISKKQKKLSPVDLIEKDFRNAVNELVAKRRTINRSSMTPEEKDTAKQQLDADHEALRQKRLADRKALADSEPSAASASTGT